MADDNSNSKVVLAALAGAAVGVVAGMLMAPKSGKETRKDLGDKANEMKDQLSELAEKGKEAAKNISKMAENFGANGSSK